MVGFFPVFEAGMVYRVIVADSSPSVQKAVKSAFSNSEFEIYAFEDGREILRHLSQIRPDIVLLRLTLPPDSGYEVARYLKSQEEFKKASLILLKGAFEQLDKKKMAELEYDDLIRVPFDSKNLVRIVQKRVESRNDPQTLPEEIDLDEISCPEGQAGLDKEIKALVRKEILEAVRELEKRIKAWLLNKLEKKESQESKKKKEE